MLRQSIHITYETQLLELYDILSHETNKGITLIVEYPGFFSHPIVLEVMVKKFNSIDTIATDDRALQHVAVRLGLKSLPLDSSVVGDLPPASEILKHNFTIFEYFLYECRRGVWHVGRFFARSKKHLTYRRPLKSSNTLLLIFSLSFSFLILIFVFYFSATSTTVEIFPETTVKTLTRNLIFTTTPNQSAFAKSNEVAMLPLDVMVHLATPFEVNSLDPNSVRNAKGMVEVINELPTPSQLRPGTRFTSEDGVLFKSPGWIKIPGMVTRNGEVIPGKIQIPLVAENVDEKGRIIGIRGNLKSGAFLSIPGLKFNKSKVYAQVIGDFSGGADPTKKVLTPETLDRFKTLFTEKLKSTAKDELDNTLRKHPGYNSSEAWNIIPLFDVWKYEFSPIETIDNILPGASVSSITLSGSLHLRTYAYSSSKTKAYFEQLFDASLLPETQTIASLNNTNISIESLTPLSQTGVESFKATMKMNGNIVYNFSNPTNPLLRQIRNLIVGRSREEALSILKNDPNVADAKISISPFFMNKVSSRPDAIDFVIRTK
ncbi:MAG: hypothetical protein U0518_04155 [Candidatus Gracilibacteria bacterium]